MEKRNRQLIQIHLENGERKFQKWMEEYSEYIYLLYRITLEELPIDWMDLDNFISFLYRNSKLSNKLEDSLIKLEDFPRESSNLLETDKSLIKEELKSNVSIEEMVMIKIFNQMQEYIDSRGLPLLDSPHAQSNFFRLFN